MTVNKRMRGRVIAADGPYFKVECPDGPPHLQLLELVRRQMGGAKLGDFVTLEYQTTPSSGLWNVVAVETL